MLTSPQPGTTRDYLQRRLDLDGVTVEVIDTAGWRPAADEIEARAQTLGRAETDKADLLLLCVEASAPALDEEQQQLMRRGGPPVVVVATKSDLATAPAELLATSAPAARGWRNCGGCWPSAGRDGSRRWPRV